jgi:hypothetical protein
MAVYRVHLPVVANVMLPLAHWLLTAPGTPLGRVWWVSLGALLAASRAVA